MKISIPFALCLVPLLAAEAAAQSPGALWSISKNVTGAPSQRRENPGTASTTKMYVFGGRSGNSGGTVLNDLWEFDGSAWTQLTANNATGSPAARDKAGVCFDLSRNKLVVFGGESATGALLNDIWEFDPTTKTWTDVTPRSPALSPSPRRFVSIAYYPLTQAIIMFGGLDASKQHLADTWMFKGGSWTQLSPSGKPAARRQHHLVTRPDFGDIILCAGQDASLSAPAKWRTDVWRMVGLNWVQIKTTTAAAAVVANDAAYDPIRKRIVLVGGNGINGGSPTGEISEFDCITNEWVIRRGKLAPDPVIGRISRYFMAYLPAKQRIYKISGQVPFGGASPTTTCEYQTDSMPTATVGSAGCPGAAGTPELAAGDLAWLGRNLVLEVKKTPATSTTLIGVGINPTSLPLTLFGWGPSSCVFTVLPDFIVPAAKNASGNPELTLPVPSDTALLKAPALMMQGLVFTGATTAIVSNRLDVKFGAL